MSNDKNSDVAFKFILRGGKARMSENVWSNMYGSMRTDDKSTDEYHVVQLRSEPYTL